MAISQNPDATNEVCKDLTTRKYDSYRTHDLKNNLDNSIYHQYNQIIAIHNM